MSRTPPLLLPLLALALGCAPGPEPEPRGEAPFPAAAAKHVVQGRVTWAGRRSEPEYAKFPSEAFREQFGGRGPVLPASEVGPQGGLPHVFVEVLDAGQRWHFPQGDALHPIRIAEFAFHPHVLGVTLGEGLQLTSDQETEHNAQLVTRFGLGFNTRLHRGEKYESKNPFRRSERAFVKSDIYPWMRAWIHVRTHPLFAVTDARGNYSLPALPAGRHRLRFSHERHGTIDMEVTLPRPEDSPLQVSFGNS